MKTTVNITINGESYEETIPNRMLLVDFIREVAVQTGTHVGCTYEGVCGACTIQLDGEAVKSCLMLAVQADGHEIKTVEGLATNGELTPLQTAFNEHHALQCGYCTPGILMSVEYFLEVNPKPNEEEIREMLSGHICRCTGYTGMVRAIKDVVRSRGPA